MNANELAEKLEDKDRLWEVDHKLMVKTCSTLRQQDARIKELEKAYLILSGDLSSRSVGGGSGLCCCCVNRPRYGGGGGR